MASDNNHKVWKMTLVMNADEIIKLFYVTFFPSLHLESP